jgi:hypothetical protein
MKEEQVTFLLATDWVFQDNKYSDKLNSCDNKIHNYNYPVKPLMGHNESRFIFFFYLGKGIPFYSN